VAEAHGRSRTASSDGAQPQAARELRQIGAHMRRLQAGPDGLDAITARIRRQRSTG
jgi:hypothetical protein